MAECNDKQPSFEESIAQIEAIARSIEEGKVGLQEMIEQHEKGIKLVKRCREMLADAEARIQQLELSDDNKLTAAPMELPQEEKNNRK